MSESKSFGDRMSGKNREWIPTPAFHIMTFIMKCMDWFGNHSQKNFKRLRVKPGQTVVDYGCGPARYVRYASEAVEQSGRVYAVDTHPAAIKKVNDEIKRFGLANATAVQAKGYDSGLPAQTADLVFALDMFHMIEKPGLFLKELARIIKPDGELIVEDGHQARDETLSKIQKPGDWTVVEQNRHHVRCVLSRHHLE